MLYRTLHRSLARELFATNKKTRKIFKIARTCLLVVVVGHGTKRKRRTRATHHMRHGVGRRAHHEETESCSVSGGALRADKGETKRKERAGTDHDHGPFPRAEVVQVSCRVGTRETTLRSAAACRLPPLTPSGPVAVHHSSPSETELLLGGRRSTPTASPCVGCPRL
jgi:hypothetical protein